MILAIGVVGAVLYFGAPACWHGVKKGAKEVGCMVQHGRKCLKK